MGLGFPFYQDENLLCAVGFLNLTNWEASRNHQDKSGSECHLIFFCRQTGTLSLFEMQKNKYLSTNERAHTRSILPDKINLKKYDKAVVLFAMNRQTKYMYRHVPFLDSHQRSMGS